MIISNLGIVNSSETKTIFATVSWEDHDFPGQELVFDISDSEPERPQGVDGPSTDAFLAACFPLAAVHGETRVRIEGRPCPMLVEGLYTAHAWWTSWGGMPSPMPSIEASGGAYRKALTGSRRGVAFLSGGVDSLHMLMRNHRLYRRDDPAYIRDALFIHGFDIGKRRRDPEDARYQTALRHLQ